MALHFYCNDKDEWEIRDKNSGELHAVIQGDDDSVLWIEQVIKDLETERDEALKKQGDHQVWNALTNFQKHLLFNSQNKYGASVGGWEPEGLREADELIELGLISKSEGDSRSSIRHNVYHTKIKGKQLLIANGED